MRARRSRTMRGALCRLVLDEELTAELKELSRRHGTTLFMTLLAAWAALLARLSGQQDVVIGTPVANRGQAEIEEPDRVLRQHAGVASGSVGLADGGRAAGAGQGAGPGGAAASGHSVRAGGGAGAAGAQSGAQSAVPGDVRLAECDRAGRFELPGWSCSRCSRHRYRGGEVRSDAVVGGSGRADCRGSWSMRRRCSSGRRWSGTWATSASCWKRWWPTTARRWIVCRAVGGRAAAGVV